MDYLLPTACDIPDIRVVHLESPSPLNPLGVKGVGEGGAIAPPSAIANAICDALAQFSAEFNQTPITPEQIVRSAGRATLLPPSTEEASRHVLSLQRDHEEIQHACRTPSAPART
jgi:carbon-monoxide dehydrogenase large subunit